VRRVTLETVQSSLMLMQKYEDWRDTEAETLNSIYRHYITLHYKYEDWRDTEAETLKSICRHIASHSTLCLKKKHVTLFI